MGRIEKVMKVVLIGYRATGKSTVGKLLAAKLKIDFRDTDAMIEKSMDMPVKEIVALHGWEFFRARERETIENLIQLENCVIATGGGVVLFRENIDLLKQNVDLLKQAGVIVWLNAPLQDIIDRLKHDAQNGATRPPFTPGNIVQETIDTMRKRFPLYEKAADFTVDTMNKNPGQVAEEIYHYLLKTGKLDKIIKKNKR